MKKTLIRLALLLLLVTLLPAIPLLSAIKNKPPASDKETSSSTQQSQAGTGDLTLPDYYRVLEKESGRILRVDPLEYLMGTAAAELPASYSHETKVAQMVAAHSYALTIMAGNLSAGDERLKGAQISNDPSRHQGYWTAQQRQSHYGDDYPQVEAQLQKAAEEAVHWLLTTDGETLLPAAYHSCSSGKTESAENVWSAAVSCLTSVDSESDKSAPNYRNEKAVPTQDAAAILQQKLPEGDFTDAPGDWVQIVEVSPSGTVLNAEVGGISCTGQELRSWFSLPSACFSLNYDAAANTLVFTSLGSGHGVGMSQYGAEQMALSGSSWQEILAHYYPQSILIQIGNASSAP